MRERCVSASKQTARQPNDRGCSCTRPQPLPRLSTLSNQAATALTSRPSAQPRHSATSSQRDSPYESAVSASKQTARVIPPQRPSDCGSSCTRARQNTILMPRRLAATQSDEHTGRQSVCRRPSRQRRSPHSSSAIPAAHAPATPTALLPPPAEPWPACESGSSTTLDLP